ncbi:hypothetical protein RB595_008338, partial [Gaeumannomyces hyphopodioides]
ILTTMSTEDAGDVPNDFVSIFRRHQEQVKHKRNVEQKDLNDREERERALLQARDNELLHELNSLQSRMGEISSLMVQNEARAKEIERNYEVMRREMERTWDSEDKQRKEVWEATMAAAEANAADEDGSDLAKGVNGNGNAAGHVSRSGTADAAPVGEAMDTDVPVRTRSEPAPAPEQGRDETSQAQNAGTSHGTAALNPASQLPTMRNVDPPVEETEEVSTGGFTAVNAFAPRKPNRSASDARNEEMNGVSKDKPPRRSLPDGKLSAPARETPFRRFAKSPSGSDAGTPRADESEAGTGQGDADDPGLPEITRSILALQHNGEVYTAPELMVGVPVRKIDENDPYWDPKWMPLVPKIEESLAVWESKYEAHALAAAKQVEGERSKKHAQFLANRQVNRGRAILEFLGARGSPERFGEINPYQLVAKQFINAAYINYDTIHRLVATLAELKKFSLDVSPLEWVRQRLHEIQSENPLGFQLSKVVGELYHDPKLQLLRSKNGFGNIGRPSGTGTKKSRGSGFAPSPSFVNISTDTPGSTPKPPRLEKRKEPHETPRGTPIKTNPASLPVLMPMPMPMSMPPMPMPIPIPTATPTPASAPAPTPAPYMRARTPTPMQMPLPIPVQTLMSTTVPKEPGFLGMALNPIESPVHSAPPPPPAPPMRPAYPAHIVAPSEPRLSAGSAPSEAVQSYRDAIRLTQAAVEDFERRNEHAAPALANKKLRLENSAPLHLPAQPPRSFSAGSPTAPMRTSSEDIHHDGYTSVDSYSGDLVMQVDWRVSVVKTSERSSGADITQYWHWVDAGQVDDGSEGNFFEHQVLSEVKPPDWGVYKDPINFHLRLTELEAVSWAPHTLRIVVATAVVPGIAHRGDVLAEFKRERTKRRLLKFMKKKEVKLIKTTAAWINGVWDSVNPVVLPGDDSDE